VRTNPYLIIHNKQGNLRLPLIGRHYWSIGRTRDNNVVIPDRWISRNHAMLQVTEEGNFYLIDLGSRNGTFVNEKRVSIPITLQDGDQITIGESNITFFCPKIDSRIGHTNKNTQRDSMTSVLHIRRLISVLVVDIRDFTVLTRSTEETVLSSLLGTWFREAGKIIREHGSWVDKYIGDALMAVWFHGHEEDEVTREEILKIIQALNDLNLMTQELSSKYPLPFPLKIGAGVNTGYGMVGNTGSGDRPDYTAIGDTVNAAFRLESASKEVNQDIVLGETTYQCLKKIEPAQRYFKHYHVALKGYEGKHKIYATTFDNLEIFLLKFFQQTTIN
jgi:adenylate cyclase